MATIAAVVLKMEAQYAEMQKGMKTARNEMKETASASQSMANTLKTAFAAAAVGMIAHSLVGHIEETIKATTVNYRLSQTLGITTGSLQALQFAADNSGIEAEELNGALSKLTKNLGEVDGDAGPAADALARIGLEGNKLAGLHVDEAFKRIAEGISKVKDPTEAGKIEMALFGKEGQKLDPLFREGAAGIEAAYLESKRLGKSMTELDAAKVVTAHEAFKNIGDAVEGVEVQLAAALAPTLITIADKITDLVPAADTMRNGFITGLRIVGKAVGYAVDAYGLLKVAVLGVAYIGISALEGIVFVTKKVADGIVWVHNKISSTQWDTPAWVKDSLDTVDTWRTSMSDQIKEAVNTPSAVSKVDAFFDNIQTKADETAKAMVAKKASFAAPISASFGEASKKIKDILKGMQDDVDNFGLSDAEKKINELKAAGAKPDQLKRAQELSGVRSQQEELKKMQEEAKKLNEDSLSPLEKYQQELTKINNLKDRGLIEDKVAAAQKLKAVNEYNAAADPNAGKKAGAETRRFNFTGPAKGPEKANPLDSLNQTAKQQAVDIKQSAFFLRQLYNFGLSDQQTADVTIDF